MDNQTIGTIFNIQRFSLVDGPGIRTTIFFKGCNLHCQWCHNPESVSMLPELEFYQEKCIGCGNCFRVCPMGTHREDENGNHIIDKNLCRLCQECARECFAEAIRIVGQTVTVNRIMESIADDMEYYRSSGGGVTFSGGECLLQYGFLEELLNRCKQHRIHTAVDTAGNVSWSVFEKIIPYTDLFLYDVKAMDSEVHLRITGSGNERILDNLARLADSDKQIIIRVPYIPGCNNAEMPAIAEFLGALMKKSPSIKRVELLGYHRLGESKYKALDISRKSPAIRIPSNDEMDNVLNVFKQAGVTAVKL